MAAPQEGGLTFPKATIRSKMTLITAIRAVLLVSPARETLFRSTPFGPWLDITVQTHDSLLTALFLQRQIAPIGGQDNELWFDISGNIIRFGREEYCLITGLRFGLPPSIPSLRKNCFLKRVFPDACGTTLKDEARLELSSLVSLIERRMEHFEHEDAVRVCLLAMVEVVFLGRQVSQFVTHKLFSIVEHLKIFNRYPWGSYTWEPTFRQLNHAWSRRDTNHGKMSISGFAYAFKIWIVEVFPISRQWFTSSNALPRGIRWNRNHVLSRLNCLEFFDCQREGRRPHAPLVVDPREEEMAWYRDSYVYFDSEEGLRASKRPRRTQGSPSPPSSGGGSGSSSNHSYMDVDLESPHLHNGATPSCSNYSDYSHHVDSPPHRYYEPFVDPYAPEWDKLDRVYYDFYNYQNRIDRDLYTYMDEQDLINADNRARIDELEKRLEKMNMGGQPSGSTMSGSTMSGNNRSGKKKTTFQAGSSQSAPKQPLRPLNDGMYRRTWTVPSTEEEWTMHGRTFSDHPITEEEHADWLHAWYSYMETPPYNEPPMYSNRPLNPDPNPPASQVLPGKLKAAVMEANQEIIALGEKWNKNRETQLEKEAVINESKAKLAVLEQTIRTEEMLVREIKEEYDVLEDKINKKAQWIIQCQDIYPY